MSSYTNVFGGQTINPTMLSYAAYTTAVDIQYVWQFEALDGSDVMAAKMDVTTSVASLSLTFPKASLVSVGQDVLIRNVGANTFTVLGYSGATLGTVASGEAWYFYLTGNSTDAGTWESVQFGAGTSSASAASLAGYGLAAVLTRLNQNLPTTALLGNYTFSVSDCATVSRSGGGATTWTFPAATTLGGGWFVYIINAGTGTLTLTPSGSDTIDGDATKAIQPDESCIVFCDGSNFNTLGYGRAITSTITAQSISIAGGAGTTTLSTVQKSAQVQNFTGAITGNRVVEYGVGAGYWFVYNNTSGAYSVTFRTDSSDAGCVVSQGSFSIIRSDGANMDVAFSATSGTVTNVATGAGLTGGPITTTGTIALATTAVTPGTYGDDPTQTVGFTVDVYGRITAASEGAIAIALSQVNAFSSADLRGRLSDETGTGLAVFGSAPTIVNATLTTPTATNPVVGTQAPGNNTTLAASTAFVTAAVAANYTFRTGDVKMTLDNAEESGVNIMLNGETIGTVASGATGRANADTQDLYVFLWDRYDDTLCPVSTGRGASGAADFAANKTLQLLDARGRLAVGWDTMGSSAANRITTAAGGVDGATLGASGGTQAKTFAISLMSGIPSYSANVGGGGTDVGGNFHTHSVTGNTTSASILNPMIVINVLVYL